MESEGRKTKKGKAKGGKGKENSHVWKLYSFSLVTGLPHLEMSNKYQVNKKLSGSIVSFPLFNFSHAITFQMLKYPLDLICKTVANSGNIIIHTSISFRYLSHSQFDEGYIF